MKVYFHLSIEGFSNCYVVVNEETKEAIIIDPGVITKEIIEQIFNKLRKNYEGKKGLPKSQICPFLYFFIRQKRINFFYLLAQFLQGL